MFEGQMFTRHEQGRWEVRDPVAKTRTLRKGADFVVCQIDKDRPLRDRGSRVGSVEN